MGYQQNTQDAASLVTWLLPQSRSKYLPPSIPSVLLDITLNFASFAIVRQRNERTENGVWGRKSTGEKKISQQSSKKTTQQSDPLSCLNQAANQPGSTAIRHTTSFSAIGCSRKDYFNLYMEHPRWCNIQNIYRYFHSHPVLIYFAAVAWNHAR